MVNKESIIVLLKGNINVDSRVQKEISNFISLGYKVTLVTWNEESIIYRNKKVSIIEVNLNNDKLPNNPILSFWRHIKFWYILSKIIKRGNYKYIHCNDLNTLGLVFFLPKEYFKNVIYDAHELFPDSRSNSIIKYKIWSFIEKRLIRKSDKVIVPEANRAQFLKEKYGLKTTSYVINNFPQYQKVIPKKIKSELNLPDEIKILCYQGNIAQNRELETIIESLEYLPDNIVLLLIGYGPENYRDQLNQFILKKKLGNRVLFYGKVLPEEMLQTIAGCDINIALYKRKGMNNYYCASNKVFDSIMAGVKLITNDYPPHSMLRDYKFISLVSENEPKEVADSVQKLVEFNSEIPEDIKRKFSWELFFDLFKEIYN